MTASARPPAFVRNADGILSVSGMSLLDIAAQHGAPLYVYSGDGIRSDYQRFADAVAPAGGAVHFALKSNSALGVIALLARAGAGADIVSGGEMARALSAGIPAEKIVFSGVGKSAQEIADALDAGIGQLNAESPQEVEAISQIAAARGVRAPVALRVNVDVAPDTHAKISSFNAPRPGARRPFLTLNSSKFLFFLAPGPAMRETARRARHT